MLGNENGKEKKKYEYNKDAQDAYMKKWKDIKLRVPEEYLEKRKKHAKSKKLSSSFIFKKRL